MIPKVLFLWHSDLGSIERHRRENTFQPVEDLAELRIEWPDELTPEDLLGVEVLVCFPVDFREEFVQWSDQLRWIHSLAAGVDGLMIPRVKNTDILITNSSGIHSHSMSEQAFGMIFSFNRGFAEFARQQTRHEWKREFEFSEAHGKTLGILGVGAIGSEIAKIGKCLGMEVIGTQRNPTQRNPTKEERQITLYPPEETPAVLKRSDYVVISLPLTEETEGSIGRRQFEEMKDTAYLINVARGDIVNQDELVEALNVGEIAGAGLDVFEEEPLPEDSSLWDMDRVIITPHVGGRSPIYLQRGMEQLGEELQRYVNEEELKNEVDKEIEY